MHLLLNAADGAKRRSTMKKFITAALTTAIAAASIASTPAMAAPFQHNDRNRIEQRHDRGNHRRVQYRNWRKGERFDYRQARNYRVISNSRAYHFRDAPRGYRWVQSGNDAVLIGITSGIVASVLAGAFH
jgi:Ni/Co efflux regulator RcnB